MTLDVMPPEPPALVRPATAQEASRAAERVRLRLKGTPILDASASEVPGLVRLVLPEGKVAYTDKEGRYYIMGIVFDLSTGQALDGALDAVRGDARKEGN